MHCFSPHHSCHSCFPAPVQLALQNLSNQRSNHWGFQSIYRRYGFHDEDRKTVSLCERVETIREIRETIRVSEQEDNQPIEQNINKQIELEPPGFHF